MSSLFHFHLQLVGLTGNHAFNFRLLGKSPSPSEVAIPWPRFLDCFLLFSAGRRSSPRTRAEHVQLLLVAGGVAGPRDARANSRWRPQTAVGRSANALEEKDVERRRGGGRREDKRHKHRYRRAERGKGARARREMHARAKETERKRQREKGRTQRGSERERKRKRGGQDRMMWTTRRTRRV